MNEEEINYCLKQFNKRRYAYRFENGFEISFFKTFGQLKELVKENKQLKDKINKAVEKLDETDYEYSSRTELFNIILNTTEILKEDNKEE